MLIGYTFDLAALFFFASSTLFSGTAPTSTPTPAPSELTVLVNGALEQSEILARLPVEITVIMRAIVHNTENKTVQAFLPFITKNRLLTGAQSHNNKPVFWRLLVNDALYRIAQQDKLQAHALVEDIVIPRHPFALALHGHFTPECLLNKEFLTLTSFFDNLIAPAFNESWTRLFASRRYSLARICPNNTLYSRSNREREFLDLLSRYERTMSWRDDRNSSACIFLRNIGFKAVKHAGRQLGEHYDFYSWMDQFAAHVHKHTSLTAPYEASAALRSITQDVYETLKDRSYAAVITAYQTSRGQPSYPEQLRQYIHQALQMPRLTETLPLELLAILRAFHQDTPVCRPFFRHVTRSALAQEAASRREIKSFWYFFITTGLLGYSQDGANHADLQELIKDIIIPSNPLLSQFKNVNLGIPQQYNLQMSPESAMDNNDPTPSLASAPSTNLQHHLAHSSELDISEEVAEFIEGGCDLGEFVESISKKAFQEMFSAILTDPLPADASLRFTFLMQTYSMAMSWHRPSHQYHYAFLINAGLESFSPIKTYDHIYCKLFLEGPGNFSASLYKKMTLESPEKANKALAALKKIDEETYKKSTHKDYAGFIKTCVESRVEIAGLEWLEECVAEILKDTEILQQLSPGQKLIIRGLQGGSTTYNPFFSYILQNYQLPHVSSNDRLLLFWRSLIFSSTHKFAQEFPELAQKLTDQPVAPFDPFSTSPSQATLLFSEDLINTGANTKLFLKKAAKWGHFHTFAFFMERNPLIAHFYTDEALFYAARKGDNNMTLLVLKKHPEIIDRDLLFNALNLAARGGHHHTIVLLFEKRPHIPDFNILPALDSAAKNGDNDTITFLFKQNPRNFCGGVNRAFEYAALGGHNDTLQVFSEKCSNIVEDTVSRALRDAAKRGHSHTVSFLLENYPNMTNETLNEALSSALYGGNGHTAGLILKSHPKVNSYYSKGAFELAAEGGYSFMMTFLLKNFQDIRAPRILRAFSGAVESDNSRTILFMLQQQFKVTNMLCLQQQRSITASHAGRALFAATADFFPEKKHGTLLLLLEQCPQITTEDVVEALCLAAMRGNNSNIRMFFEQRPEITAGHAGKALYYAAKSGKCDTILLLFEQRPEITTDDVVEALRVAASYGVSNDAIRGLLEKRPEITADHASKALCAAACSAPNATIEFLFEEFPEMTADHAGEALCVAAWWRRSIIVQMLLDKRPSIKYHYRLRARINGNLGNFLQASLVE